MGNRCIYWRILAATVAAGLVTFFHIMGEGLWFSPLVDIFPEPSNPIERLYAYSFVSAWHVAWIYGLSWGLIYMLAGDGRAEMISRILGGVMACGVLGGLIVRFPAGLGGEDMGLSWWTPACWALLTAVCILGLITPRELAGPSGSRKVSSKGLILLWIGLGGLFVVGLRQLHFSEIDFSYGFWPIWSVLGGILLSAGCSERAHAE